MFTRSLALVLAVGALGAVGCVAGSDGSEDQSAVSQNTGSGGGFGCSNNTVDVLCQGSILTSILAPVTVTIKDVGNGTLDGNKLSILSGDLDNVSILDGGILNNNKILNDFNVNTLNDFLDKFSVIISGNKVTTCLNLLGVLPLCKTGS